MKPPSSSHRRTCQAVRLVASTEVPGLREQPLGIGPRVLQPGERDGAVIKHRPAHALDRLGCRSPSAAGQAARRGRIAENGCVRVQP